MDILSSPPRLAAVLLLLGLAQWFYLTAADSRPGFRVETRPGGARAYLVQADLFVSQQGAAVGGRQEVPLGRTPGPLRVSPQDFPATIIFRLWGYRDLDYRFPAGSYTPERPRFGAVLRLEPALPGAAALYFLRDWPFLTAGILLVALALRARVLRRRRAEDERQDRLRIGRGELRPGDRVHGYLLEEPVGRGGMARVFAARREGERVALKVLYAADEDSAARFRREVDLWRGLNHPNVVHLLDWGEVEGHLYLVMEFVEGESLAARLTRGLPERRLASAWGLELARALEVAHARGIVHRDLSPNNVMITPEGRAILMDFGLARRQSEASGAQGTPGSAAPEQLEGGKVDYRSDLYSLGVLLYLALSGCHPFTGATPLQVVQRQRSGDFVPLQDQDPETPPELAALVDRLLHRRPEVRAQSVEQVRRELEGILDGEGVR